MQIERLSFVRANTHTADVKTLIFVLSFLHINYNETHTKFKNNLLHNVCYLLLNAPKCFGLIYWPSSGSSYVFNICSLCFTLCGSNSTYVIKIILRKIKYHNYWNKFLVKIYFKVILISSWCNLLCPNVYFSIFLQKK